MELLTVESQQPAAARALLVRIDLPEDLANHFEGLAAARGTTIEAELVSHLQRTRDWCGSAPIFLADAHAAEIRRLLGGRVSTADKLIDMVRRLVTWRVGGHKIELSPAKAEALHFYIQSLQQPPDRGAQHAVDAALGWLLKC